MAMHKLHTSVSSHTSMDNLGGTTPGSSFINLTESLKRQTFDSAKVTFLKPIFDNTVVSCFFCDIEFDNLIKLQCHQLLYKHKCLPTTKQKENEIWIECRKCKMVINFHDYPKSHKCQEKLEKDMLELYKNMNFNGIPMFCILCEAKPLFSRVELIIHLISVHSENIYINRCAICDCKFKSESIFAKTDHMMNEHLGEMEINVLKLVRIQKEKLITVSPFLNPMMCIFKTDKLKICGRKFDNLAHFTLHILCEHCDREDMLFSRKKKSIFTEKSSFNCRRCDRHFTTKDELQSHIIEYHQTIYEKHLNYLIQRKVFTFKFNPLHTCFLCMKSFASQLIKDVHIYVSHWSKNWLECGLCGREILDKKYMDLSDNLQYKLLKVHEKFHIRSIKSFITQKETNSELTKDFDISLIPKPKLYVDTYIPMKIIQQQELERILRKRIFPKEIKNHFVLLGSKNRKVQEDLEING